MEKSIPIILDTDIGDDIDDALALALILRSPELDLKGITTVYGDAVARSRQARTILKLAGRTDIPVAVGCGAVLSHKSAVGKTGKKEYQGKSFLHPAYNYLAEVAPSQDKSALPESALPPLRPQHAVDYLIEQYREKSDVTLVTIGALTNVAMAIVKEPRIVLNIPRIVAMAGVFYMPMSEYNIECDPVAAAIVADSGVPMRWIGLDVTLPCKFTREQVERFNVRENPLAKNLYDATQAWSRDWLPTLHDPLAVETLFRPDMVTFKRGLVAVELADSHTWGYTIFKENAEGPHEIGTAVKADEAVAFYIERVLGK